MVVFTNYGTINYTIGPDTDDMSSNIVSTELNVIYETAMLKAAVPVEFAPDIEIIYQIHVENTGTGTLYNLVVTDDMGAVSGADPLTYVADSASAFLYNSSGTVVSVVDVTVAVSPDEVTFALAGTLPQGYYIVLTYTALVKDTVDASVKSITNIATLTANEGSESGAEYSDTASTTITRDIVTIVKTASNTSVSPGDSLIYTFALTNIGDEEVAVNTLSDQLPLNFDKDNKIIATIGSTAITYDEGTDYTVTAGNYLTIDPAVSSTPLTVPAAVGGTAGVTTITISGTISA